jgi:hypothetical protein
MKVTTTATQPFKKCCLDIVGPLTETQTGNNYILTFRDELSKFLIAIPIPRQNAETSKGIRNTYCSEARNTCKMLRIQNYRPPCSIQKAMEGWSVAIEY